MATRTRIPQTLIAIASFTSISLSTRIAFGQEDVVERLADNPGNSALVIGLATVAIPAFLSYLAKKAEAKGVAITTRTTAESVFAQRTIDGLEGERKRLLAIEERLEETNSQLKQQLYENQLQAKVCEERLKQKDERIVSLSRRLAVYEPVTGEV